MLDWKGPARLMWGGLLIALVGVGCSRPVAPPPMPPPEVEVVVPTLRPVVETRDYTGRLEPVERVAIRARVAGFLDKVHFKEGTEVTKGSLLYEIDPRTYQAEVNRDKAEVARLEDEYRLAETEAARAARLRVSSAVSEEEFERRSVTKRMAAAALARSQAQLKTASLSLGFTRIVAPIDGRVSRTLVTPGNLVGQSEPTLLTYLVRMDQLYLTFEITESDLLSFARSLGNGDKSGKATVRFALASDTDFSHEAVIDFRDNEVDPSSGTMLIRGVVDNTTRRYTPGLFARVRLATREPIQRPHIPETALGTDQRGRYVLVVDDKGMAQRRGVTLGPIADGMATVMHGLKGGEQVIVRGQIRVRPGSPVAIATEPETAKTERTQAGKASHEGKGGHE